MQELTRQRDIFARKIDQQAAQLDRAAKLHLTALNNSIANTNNSAEYVIIRFINK